MRAQAAPTTTSPRPASGGASVGASAAVSPAADVRTSDVLLPYPLLHDSNYFDHEASGRKHARMLSNRVAREATWIDAVGQDRMNRKFTDSDSKRKRNKVTRDAAISTRVRVVNDDVGHRLAGLPDNPPLTTVTVAAPTVLVPDEDKRWSFEFKDWSEDQVEHELAALQTAVDAAYSAPAVVKNETVLLSPPSGTSEPRLFASPSPSGGVRLRPETSPLGGVRLRPETSPLDGVRLRPETSPLGE